MGSMTVPILAHENNEVFALTNKSFAEEPAAALVWHEL
jgi:hypothetical protein